MVEVTVGDTAQLAQCSQSLSAKPWVPSSRLHKLCGASYLQSLCLGSRGRKVRRSRSGHLWLHSESEASLTYRRACLKSKQPQHLRLCVAHIWTYWYHQLVFSRSVVLLGISPRLTAAEAKAQRHGSCSSCGKL